MIVCSAGMLRYNVLEYPKVASHKRYLYCCNEDPPRCCYFLQYNNDETSACFLEAYCMYPNV